MMRKEVLSLLDDLAAEERTRLTTREVREELDLSPQAASNLMTRLVEAGFLDRAARPDLVGGWLTLATALERASLNPERLALLSTQLDAAVPLRRVASLAELQGRLDVVRTLRPPDPTARVVPLDPREHGDE